MSLVSICLIASVCFISIPKLGSNLIISAGRGTLGKPGIAFAPAAGILRMLLKPKAAKVAAAAAF